MNPTTAPSGLAPWLQPALQRLWQLHQADHLPHALLLCGPEGVGKQALTDALAAALLCQAPQADGRGCGTCTACQQLAAGFHADYWQVTPEEGARVIAVDAVRRLCEHSGLSRHGHSRRVVCIAPAEGLNVAAANALLKTLEEPVGATLMVLNSARPDRLPATIRSRCQRLDIAPPTATEAAAWLAEQAPEAPAARLLALTGGAPLAALAAHHNGLGERVSALLTALQAVALQGADPMQAAGPWKDADLDELCRLLLMVYADLLSLHYCPRPPRLFHAEALGHLQALAPQLPARAIVAAQADLRERRAGLSHNLNPQLLAEAAFLTWGRLTATATTPAPS